MRWLVDGYNVIRRDPDLRSAEAESLEAGRRALLARIAAVAGRSPDRFTVVFDGAPGFGAAAPGGRIELVFSRPPESADDVVRRLARQAGSGGAVVVSSDRAVADAARRAGCAAVGAEAFMTALTGQSGGENAEDDEDDEDAGASPRRRGNPRKLSKEARAARRALERLRAAR